jgi:crotonobetainyl-CoA:carnitine CoA-transferase CaiB-like acyl-CoA transferase
LDISIVHSAKELAEHPLFEAREFFVEIDHPLAGKIKIPGAPCKFSATPSRVKRAAPLLGQHNSEVFGQMLGYRQEKLDKMNQAGII